MATGWKLTARMKARLAGIARLRCQDPGDAILAREFGVSVRTVQYHINKLRFSERLPRMYETYLRSGAVIPRVWMVQYNHERDTIPTDPPADGA